MRVTERYFVKLLLVVKYTFYNIIVLWPVAFDVKYDKNFDLGAICCKKITNFRVRSEVKTDPFISFWADLFVYLRHIRILIKEKLTRKIVSCV